MTRSSESGVTDPSGSTTRRSFLNRLWALITGLFFVEFGWLGASLFRTRSQTGRERVLDTMIVAGKTDDFKPNTATAIPQGQFYLACLEDGSLLALSRTCTHLGCSVPWDEEQQKFVCPCHGSTFNLIGEVLTAPAPRPLDTFPVRIEDRVVKVDVSQPRRRQEFQPSQATWLG